MFEEIKNGSTRFSIGEDQICETCHNARMIKVFIHYETNLHILLTLFLIVVSFSMCFFSRTDSSFFLYLNSASNLVTIITGITQCKGIRIPESGKFVFVESGKTLLVESAILGYGIRNQLNEAGVPLNPESKFHWQTLECSTWNPESTAWNPQSKTVLDSFTWGDR